MKPQKGESYIYKFVVIDSLLVAENRRAILTYKRRKNALLVFEDKQGNEVRIPAYKFTNICFSEAK